MKIKVGVFFGGKSVEHEISIISAIQAAGYLDRTKYDVIPIYITKNNEFYVGGDIDKIEAYTEDVNALLKRSQRVIPVNDGGRVNLIKYPQKMFSKGFVDYIDIALPVVHGTNVEDGTLQGYLQMLGIPYVGCGVLSSAVGMDKYVMKTVLKDNGIPVLDCKCCNSKMFDADSGAVIHEIETEIGFPVIVKPVNLGSSIGISKANDRAELQNALETAFCYAEKVLVETAVQNLKEINCSVLGDFEHADASECEEPIMSGDILDFEKKYLGGGGAKGTKGAKAGTKSGGSKGMASLSRKIPAEITAAQRDEIREMAVKTFKCLGCNGVSRIDFMMDSKTGKIWLNEINTIPGSLSFYLWEPLGVKYPELLDRMIALALKRERENENITYTFDSNVLRGAKVGGGAKGAKGSKM